MSRSVLIVDDHVGFRRQARRLFEEAGFVVVGEAGDGRSAITAANELSPDLVLLDVMLPDMSGLQVAHLIPDASSILLVSSRSADDLGIGDLGERRRFLRKDELSLERLRSVARGGS
jgi:DNA-binding NarL/FixJ family response regulator